MPGAASLEELERLHAAAVTGDEDATDECLAALPGLLTELRAARAGLDLARRNSREHDAAIGQANAGLQDSSRRIVALEAELAALREVAEAARPFVPVCDEDVSSDENGHGLACGKTATHHSRMGGNNIGYLCDEHTELAHAAAVRAASKGWSKAIDLEAPSTFDADPIVRDLASALAKVPK